MRSGRELVTYPASAPGPLDEVDSTADFPIVSEVPADAAGAARVRRNVAVLAVAQMITWSMTLLWTLVVPRTLGPSGMGTIMAAWSITGILGVVLGLGTRNYLVRESVLDPEKASGLVGTALVIRIALSPLLLGAAFVYAQVVGWDGDAKIVLYLAAAATIFVQIAEPMQAGFQATERMEYLAYSDVISKSAQGLVGIAVVLVGFGTIGVTACWAVMTAIVVLLDAYWLHRFVRINLRTTWARSVKVVRESLAYWAFGLFFMIYLWIDFVMLSLMTRSEVVGWYAVPTRLFQTLTFLPVVVATASLPHFVRGFEEGGDRLRRAAKSPLELVLVVSLPIAAAVAITAAPVIHLLYGSAYDHAVPVMVILGLCLPPMYLNIVLAQVLIAMNRQVVWTCVMAATTVINPLFNLALIPWTQHRYGNGAIGAATSLLLTELVCIVVAFVMVARTVFDASTVKRALLAIVAATAMWAAGYETRSFGVVVSLAAAAVAFVVLAVVLRLFTSEDVAAMKSGFTRVAQRVPGLKRRVAPPTAAAAGVPPPA